MAVERTSAVAYVECAEAVGAAMGLGARVEVQA